MDIGRRTTAATLSCTNISPRAVQTVVVDRPAAAPSPSAGEEKKKSGISDPLPIKPERRAPRPRNIGYQIVSRRTSRRDVEIASEMGRRLARMDPRRKLDILMVPLGSPFTARRLISPPNTALALKNFAQGITLRIFNIRVLNHAVVPEGEFSIFGPNVISTPRCGTITCVRANIPPDPR